MKKYTMHVISGTHWDREWRHTAEQSKPRLAELVDGMMDTLEQMPEYKAYCLDGGYVVLDDYLTVRPENWPRLKKLVDAGRVQFVRWYTLPETYTVAPEALIRNLKLGKTKADKYGGAMKSGYTATSYGQTSQLPQIYQGFGIENAIFYRGTHKHMLQPLFKWEAPDGSVIHTLRTFDEVTRTNWFFYVHQPLVVGKTIADLSHVYDKKDLPVHMCDDKLYERGLKVLREDYEFTKTPDVLKNVLKAILEQAKGYVIEDHLLALNMEDNDVPCRMLPAMIDALNEVSDDTQLVQSTLDEYMDAIVSDSSNNDLPLHIGEIRYPTIEEGFNALLGATHSSRARIKVLNERAETGLMYHAEPLASFAYLLGCEYPKPFLDRAWQHLLLNHAHDSICGAAVDQAHEDMLFNFSIAQNVADEITARSAQNLFMNIDTSCFKEEDYTLTFFNTLPWEREEVVQAVIDLPKKLAKGIDRQSGLMQSEDVDIEYFDILDSEGKKIDYEILSKEPIKIGVERQLDTNGIKMPAVRWRVLLKANVPSMGYATYALRPRGPECIPFPETMPDRKLMARPSGILENDNLKVRINSNGTFDMLDKITGRVFENMHYFTDEGQTGDAHLSKKPMRNTVQTSIGSQAKITMLESNELRGTYKIELSLRVPAAATLDARDRLHEQVTIPVTVWLTLEKDSPMLKIRTRLTNQARDHRLQVHFPSNVQANQAAVESAFAIEHRNIQWTDTADNRESFYAFQPMQNFVDLSDGKAGLAILNQGIREYEMQDDDERTMSITLLRTQRAYMTANDMMTPEEFDRYTGLHSFGTHEYRYALYPHQGDWASGKVLQRAYEHKVAFNGIQGVTGSDGKLPPKTSLMRIEPSEGLMLSAVKLADDESGVIVRVWNTTDKSLKGTIDTNLPITAAAKLKLDETLLEELKVENANVHLKIEPHKIETILLKR